jgi:actin-related protein 10
MRRTLAENLIVIGGTSMLPGFKHRLRAELYSLLKQPCYAEKLSLPAFKFHKYPAQPNYVAWLGGTSSFLHPLYQPENHLFRLGSILGSLETLASKSVTKEAYTQPIIPDWCSVYIPEEKEKIIGATKKLEAAQHQKAVFLHVG